MQHQNRAGLASVKVLEPFISHKDLQKPIGGNRLFPVFLKTETLRLVIIGGGVVGLEKLRAVLANAPASPVRLISITICDEIKELTTEYENLELFERPYTPADFEFCDLIIAAVNDQQMATTIRNDAKFANRLVNVADNPALCDFYLSAVVQKGDLKIAISTNGKSPTLAKRLKEILVDTLPEEIDSLMHNLQTLRLRLSGDFNSKVIRLNEITRMLVEQGPSQDISKALNSSKFDTTELVLPNDSPAADLPAKDFNSRGISSDRLTGARIISWIGIALFFMILGALVFQISAVNIFIARTGNFAAHLNAKFYWMVLTGFAAQIIAGSLGMGFGVICTTILLSLGISLPAISSSIHTAETFASGVSGYSHYKFGNVNKKLFKSLILPGVIGAIIGAVILSLYGDKYAAYIKPVLALYTLFLGVKILGNAFQKKIIKKKIKNILILAGAGGFIDSFGGGGWGPLVTSSFIAQGRSPRFVVGSVSLSKFFVSLASALTFFSMMGISNWEVIAGLLIGGIIAAPISAKLAGLIPTKSMFIAVGILVILCSLRLLVKSF